MSSSLKRHLGTALLVLVILAAGIVQDEPQGSTSSDVLANGVVETACGSTGWVGMSDDDDRSPARPGDGGCIEDATHLSPADPLALDRPAPSLR